MPDMVRFPKKRQEMKSTPILRQMCVLQKAVDRSRTQAQACLLPVSLSAVCVRMLIILHRDITCLFPFFFPL